MVHAKLLGWDDQLAMHASCQVDCIQNFCRKSPEIKQFDGRCTVFSHAAPRMHQKAATAAVLADYSSLTAGSMKLVTGDW